MKKRLIANGIISLLMTILFVLMIVGILLFSKSVTAASNIENISLDDSNIKSLGIFGFSLLAYLFLSFVSFIMGIVTLVMEKHPSVQGLTVASGILALFGGFLFINAIVSFVAATRIDE